MEKISDMDELIERIKKAKKDKKSVSIAYHGNIVSIWERLAKEKEKLCDLGSDQTSLHNPFNGGYYPVQITFEESQKMMKEDPEKFKKLVQESLVRQISAINKLTEEKELKFWDYGNSFLLEADRAGADVKNKNEKEKDYKPFKYPSYVQDIMGDIFSMGFGPFRWVCLSNDPKDLKQTDLIASQVFLDLLKKYENKKDDELNEFENFQKQLYKDNYNWIVKADDNKMVVGSQARILYSDIEGRIKLALEMNNAVKSKKITGCVAISRDHHDVSGADSPWRETSCVYDGSFKCADMSVQTVIGNAMRGATWVALHNGGGTGWGEAMNCGFGLVLDGSEETEIKLKNMLFWDVANGISRRAWSGNKFAKYVAKENEKIYGKYKLTKPNDVDDKYIDDLFK